MGLAGMFFFSKRVGCLGSPAISVGETVILILILTR
jgi:hypothetical protein